MHPSNCATLYNNHQTQCTQFVIYTLIQNYNKNSETPTCFEPYRFIIRDYIK
jgi:hypothetical protein